MTLTKMHINSVETDPVGRQFWLPTLEQKAVLDLARIGEDMKATELKALHSLSALLLSHCKVYTGKSK